MQQRQLRLGDIVDDYCPRERRLANHTIVAMVGDEIRLTRCTTCDAEHPYKGGKAPRQRKKGSAQAAYDEVLDTVKKESEVPGTLVPHAGAVPPGEPQAPGDAPGEPAAEDAAAAPAPEDEIRLHRPLIRASLPRIEAQPPARPIPEFTIRQANRHGRFQSSRAARFAKGRGGPGGNQGGMRGPGGGSGGRHSGRPQGHGPQGHGPQGRPPQGGRHSGQHAGKKRSR